MRRITIVTREDLDKKEKLTPTKDISWSDFTPSLKESIIPMSDLVIFHCTLTNECKTLKSRFGTVDCCEILQITTPEDKVNILHKLMGI